MKLILAAALISVASSSAYAQGFQAQTCFTKIPTLAAKLGIAPLATTGSATIAVSGCNGKSYDLIALLNALVDKMDRSAKK